MSKSKLSDYVLIYVLVHPFFILISGWSKKDVWIGVCNGFIERKKNLLRIRKRGCWNKYQICVGYHSYLVLNVWHLWVELTMTMVWNSHRESGVWRRNYFVRIYNLGWIISVRVSRIIIGNSYYSVSWLFGHMCFLSHWLVFVCSVISCVFWHSYSSSWVFWFSYPINEIFLYYADIPPIINWVSIAESMNVCIMGFWYSGLLFLCR